jgi:DeoR/GlpR family transcriptional regulator of sugar metabolism
MSSHLANYRMQLIMSVLAAQGECRISELARRFSLSENTIRRDLLKLEEQGLLQRVHGGAVLINEDAVYRESMSRSLPQKRAIGRAAVSLIESGQHVFIDAGTTALELAQAMRHGLPGVTHLHIYTHGVNIARELIGQTPYTLHLIGGEIYQNTASSVGPTALSQIEALRFDLFFMGANGVDAQRGWTNSNHMEVLIKRAVLERSKHAAAIVDSTKWNQSSLATIVPLGAVREWIVDDGLGPGACTVARAANVRITVARAQSATTMGLLGS